MDIEKLLLSKAIMDKHNQMGRGQATNSLPSMQLENFDAPQAKYNIPQDMLESSPRPMAPPMSNPSKAFAKPSVDAIKNSRLPDEIKKLMIEHPIDTPNSMVGPTLSDDLVEKAARLMKNNLFEEQKTPASKNQQIPQSSDLKKMIKEAVREVMLENNMLVESTEKTTDTFKFQVGKHIFEGKLTKIKKLS